MKMTVPCEDFYDTLFDFEMSSVILDTTPIPSDVMRKVFGPRTKYST